MIHEFIKGQPKCAAHPKYQQKQQKKTCTINSLPRSST